MLGQYKVWVKLVWSRFVQITDWRWTINQWVRWNHQSPWSKPHPCLVSTFVVMNRATDITWYAVSCLPSNLRLMLILSGFKVPDFIVSSSTVFRFNNKIRFEIYLLYRVCCLVLSQPLSSYLSKKVEKTKMFCTVFLLNLSVLCRLPSLRPVPSTEHLILS